MPRFSARRLRPPESAAAGPRLLLSSRANRGKTRIRKNPTAHNVQLRNRVPPTHPEAGRGLVAGLAAGKEARQSAPSPSKAAARGRSLPCGGLGLQLLPGAPHGVHRET